MVGRCSSGVFLLVPATNCDLRSDGLWGLLLQRPFSETQQLQRLESGSKIWILFDSRLLLWWTDSGGGRLAFCSVTRLRYEMARPVSEDGLEWASMDQRRTHSFSYAPPPLSPSQVHLPLYDLTATRPNSFLSSKQLPYAPPFLSSLDYETTLLSSAIARLPTLC
ncbi:hypothetical protein MRB53_034923 [Persea americana]|uniref:Uncharacterized protein n=1 Tax=Persea americana TaxID=3435 RepID=A0ACC2K358_PERAE|nr:hypothetical protein MRB53_034923 [Persea americana]